MLGIDRHKVVAWAVSLVVVTSILAVVSDRLNRGMWTFGQVGWWSLGILTVMFFVLMAYCVIREHMTTPRRGY